MAILSVDNTLNKLRRDLCQYADIPPDRDIVILPRDEFRQFKNTSYNLGEEKINDLHIITYSFDGKKYISIIGDINIEAIENTDEIELNVLHFLIAIGLSSVAIKNNIKQDEAEQYLYPLVAGEGSLDFHQIFTFFPSIKVFEIEPKNEIESSTSLRKILIHQIFNSPEYRHLSFTDEFLNELQVILERDFFDEFILEAYLAEKWIYCYLRLYRCLEPLFNNLIAKNLKQSLNLEVPVEEITKTIGGETLVMPDEKTSISRLFELLSEPAFEEFKRVFNIDGNPDTKKSTIGRYVYKIRNKIVHHPRSSSSKKDNDDIDMNLKSISDEQWNNLCVCLLKAIYSFNIALT